MQKQNQSITIQGIRIEKNAKGKLIFHIPTKFSGDQLIAFKAKFNKQIQEFKKRK